MTIRDHSLCLHLPFRNLQAMSTSFSGRLFCLNSHANQAPHFGRHIPERGLGGAPRYPTHSCGSIGSLVNSYSSVGPIGSLSRWLLRTRCVPEPGPAEVLWMRSTSFCAPSPRGNWATCWRGTLAPKGTTIWSMAMGQPMDEN